MSTTERVMLYAVAFIVGGMLLLDRGGTDPQSSAPPANDQALPVREQKVDLVKTDVLSPAPQAKATNESPVASSPRDNAAEPFVIEDDAGHRRIELLVNDDGQAQLVLRSRSGEPGVILSVDADGESVVTIIRGDRMGKILATRDGELTLSLASRQSGFEATVPQDGGSRLLLTGPDCC